MSNQMSAFIYNTIDVIEHSDDLYESQKMALFGGLIATWRKMGFLDFGLFFGHFPVFEKSFRIVYNATDPKETSKLLKEARESLGSDPRKDSLVSRLIESLDKTASEAFHLRETVGIYEAKNRD